VLSRLLRTVLGKVSRQARADDRLDAVLRDARRLRAQGKIEAARQLLEENIARFPAEAQLCNSLGMLQMDKGDFSIAERSFRRALELRPGFAHARTNLGIALSEQNRTDESLQAFRQAIEADPSLLEARVNIAALFSRQNEISAALDAWDEVLKLDAGHAEAHAGKATLLVRAGLFEEAKRQLVRARGVKVDSSEFVLLDASIETAIGNVAAAKAALEALRIREPSVDVEWLLALLHLSQGNFSEGWPLYEARLRLSFESPRRAYTFPNWDGNVLQGETLLIMAEQGLGDEIMFSSCYPDVAAHVSDCVIECDPRLAPLFARSFPQAEVVGHSRGNNADWLKRYPDISRQVHAGSLPGFYRSNRSEFPDHNGYLRADPRRVDEWRAHLKTLGPELKIGISWNGGLQHTRRALRSIPLQDFSQLLRGHPGHFVSLQHDDRNGQAKRLAELSGRPVHCFAGVFRDIDESAALITSLDLVITACSTVVHLSGALGTCTWVLTPRVAEWRYLDHGETMPWYPSVRLFRQTRLGVWQPVVERISNDLRRLVIDQRNRS